MHFWHPTELSLVKWREWWLSKITCICRAPRLSFPEASLSMVTRARSAAVPDGSCSKGCSSGLKGPSFHSVTFLDRIVVTCFLLSPQESVHGASIYNVVCSVKFNDRRTHTRKKKDWVPATNVFTTIHFSFLPVSVATWFPIHGRQNEIHNLNISSVDSFKLYTYSFLNESSSIKSLMIKGCIYM